MNFQTTILLISFAVAVVLALIIIPTLKKIKVGQIEREDGPQSHLKKQGTPTMGGIIFMLSIALCTFRKLHIFKTNRKCRYSKQINSNVIFNNRIWNCRICR